MNIRRLWLAFGSVVVWSFAVLGWTGIRIYQQAPPVPDRVVVSDGRELIGAGEIHLGQNVWQSMGGMEVGSVWGHGRFYCGTPAIAPRVAAPAAAVGDTAVEAGSEMAAGAEMPLLAETLPAGPACCNASKSTRARS